MNASGGEKGKMEATKEKANSPPWSFFALNDWWKGLFAKKKAEEEVQCWSCRAIRNTGLLPPWDIDCRNCESPVTKKLGEQRRRIDLDKILDSFSQERDYRWIFSMLGFLLKREGTVKYVIKIDFRKQEVDSFAIVGKIKIEMIPIGFFWWRDFVKTLEGIFWVGKRPFILMEKGGVIYRAKMSLWHKGIGETLMIDVVPEKGPRPNEIIDAGPV